MRIQHLGISVFIVAFGLVSGCDASNSASTSPESSRVQYSVSQIFGNKSRNSSRPSTPDEQFLTVSSRFPRFAGLFLKTRELELFLHLLDQSRLLASELPS